MWNQTMKPRSKMQQINSWGAKKTVLCWEAAIAILSSYSIQVYWSNICILLKKVIKLIEQQFRRFYRVEIITDLLSSLEFIVCDKEWGEFWVWAFGAQESWGLKQGNNHKAYMEVFCSKSSIWVAWNKENL